MAMVNEARRLLRQAGKWIFEGINLYESQRKDLHTVTLSCLKMFNNGESEHTPHGTVRSGGTGVSSGILMMLRL